MLNSAPTPTTPAKLSLLESVEILRKHNEWRRANSEDEAPIPSPHSAELVGKAIDRVCELVPEYVHIAKLIHGYWNTEYNDFEAEFGKISSDEIGEALKKLLQK